MGDARPLPGTPRVRALDSRQYFNDTCNMETEIALRRLSALAHEGWLSVFRLLVKAGPPGLPAGEIARSVDAAPNTMSAQLLVLSNAGLIRARREGRSIFYAADYPSMTSLLQFLTKDCCDGRPEICAPLSKIVAQCCMPKKRSRS